MGYFQVRKGRAKDWNTPQTKTGENIISYIVWVVQILKYSKGSLLIKPRKASKTFRSILSLLLMTDLGQIKKLSTRRGLYMYSTKDLRSLPKPRSLLEMRSNQSVSFVEGAIVNTWPTQVGAFLSMGEFTLFIWNRQVEKLFFKWYHNQVKRTILLLYVAQQKRQMKWTKRFGPALHQTVKSLLDWRSFHLRKLVQYNTGLFMMFNNMQKYVN